MLRIQIITITRSIKGGQIRKQQARDCEQLTVGRGTDQILHVPDPRAALQHAQLQPAGHNRWRLESLSPAGVLLNGKRVRTGKLKPGDHFSIGASEFTLREPTDEYAAVIEVQHHPLPDMQSHPAIKRYVATHIGTGFFGLRRRGLAWLALLVVISAGLIIPMAGFFQPDLQQTLQANRALPDDHIWLTGELFSGHQHLEGDCSYCHRKPFVRVADPVCAECHADTRSHADPPPEGILSVAELEAFNHPDVAAQQCAHCHREHNGARIIPAKQSFCGDCHGDLEQRTGYASALPAATDFADHHPQFSTTLTRRDIDGGIRQLRMAIDDPDMIEQSQLSFPHDRHLDPAGLETPSGFQVLSCADCHQPDAGGRYMQPIDFETQCVQCHQLNFDPSNPERVVPHGKPAEVVNVLTEFYAELALRGASREVSNLPLNSNDPSAVLLWARQQALRTGNSLFEGRACGECHQVTRQENAAQITWTIQPPRVAGIWFPRSSFDHSSHLATECSVCHDAATSASSDDVLLPGIAVCQDCHGGEHTRNRVASTCIACHRYHQPVLPYQSRQAEPKSGTLYLWNQPDIERASQATQPARTNRRRPGRDDGA